MKKLFALLILLAVPLVLAACTSMSPDECRIADWNRTGYTDGAAGEDQQSSLAAYATDCAEAGVRPDTVAYRAGWDAGIATYCTAATGWREGVEGRTWKEDACRGQRGDSAFSQALKDGLKVNKTNREIQSMDTKIQDLEQKLQKTQKDNERRSLRDQIRALDRQQASLRDVLRRQESLRP